jgi:hypothetical protein
MGVAAPALMAPPPTPPDVVLVLHKMLSAEMLADPQEILDVRCPSPLPPLPAEMTALPKVDTKCITPSLNDTNS